MAKRQRSLGINSGTEQGKAFRSEAAGLPSLPGHIKLRDGDEPFFESVVKSKRIEAWSELDLTLAANLAACLKDIKDVQGQIDIEGNVIDKKIHPLHPLLDVLTKRSLSLSRTLQIHSLATHGRSGDQGKRNRAARSARDAIASGDRCLIPGLEPN